MPMYTGYRGLYRSLVEKCRSCGIEAAEAETEYFLAEEAGVSYPELRRMIAEDTALSDCHADKLGVLIRRRFENHEPSQYIFSRAYFMDMVLRVTPDVLIPRPETEILCEKAAELLPESGSLLDLGTGSGCIACAIKRMRPDVTVTGVDISSAALAVAADNADKSGLDIEWLESDLFSALSGRKFDVIAANLPYVNPADYPGLMPEVRDYEPVSALTAPDNGAALFNLAADEVQDYLNSGGSAVFEVSPEQISALRTRLIAKGVFSTVGILYDYTGRARDVVAENYSNFRYFNA